MPWCTLICVCQGLKGILLCPKIGRVLAVSLRSQM